MSVQREIAMDFLRLASAGKVREAFDKFIDPTFRHHNAYFPGNRESLLHAMEESANTNPNKRFEIKMTLEDGDLVACYSYVQQTGFDADREIAVVHVFRFKGEKIVEMWDVGMLIPPSSPNQNGMF